MLSHFLLARTIPNRLAAAFSTQTGTVKWFDPKKGFGFIIPDDPDNGDIFVHQSAIHAQGFRSLADGEPVEYSVVKDDSGRVRAENVTGPMGAFVQGRPPPPRRYDDDGGFGGGFQTDRSYDDSMGQDLFEDEKKP